MSEPRTPSKSERKKARRRAKLDAERVAGRELEALADVVVERVEALATEVVDAPDRLTSERAFDIEFPTADAARFVLKRVNEVLAVGEWLDDVEAWVWEAASSTRPPRTEAGARTGVELRLEQARPHPQPAAPPPS